MLHGFTGTWRTWMGLIPTLSRHYQVIIPDLLGHGDTTAPPDPDRYRIEYAAADLITLLDTLKLEQVALLGYSMGGRLALYTATHYPERIAALSLESASPGLRTRQEQIARQQHDNALADRIEQDGIVAFVEEWEALALWQSQQHTLSEAARQQLRQERLGQRPIGLANSLRGMGTGTQPSLWHQLPNLNIPVQLIVGELDSKFVEINHSMSAMLPQAQLEIIPGVGHAVHLENTPIFHQHIDHFLNKDKDN